MKVGIKLGKVKKFGIGWCIHHRMAADNAEGGLDNPPPPPHGIGLRLKEGLYPLHSIVNVRNHFEISILLATYI